MAQIGDYMHISAWFVAPVFDAVCPHILASRYIIIPSIRACISRHEWSTWTLLIVQPVSAASDVDLEILEVIILICVRIRVSIEDILIYEYCIDHLFLAKIKAKLTTIILRDKTRSKSRPVALVIYDWIINIS